MGGVTAPVAGSDRRRGTLPARGGSDCPRARSCTPRDSRPRDCVRRWWKDGWAASRPRWRGPIGGEALFQRAAVRIVLARVAVPQGIVALGTAFEGGGKMDGRRHGPGGGVDMAARMDGPGLDLHHCSVYRQRAREPRLNATTMETRTRITPKT